MKKSTKLFSIWVLTLVLLNVSCRKEEFESIGATPEQNIQADSRVANLLFRTSIKDGSEDNILDMASCFSISLPVTVIVNGMEIDIETEEDLEEIETIFEESDEDTDTLEIVFPVTIVFSDYTEETVSSAEELEGFAETCPDENEEDEDIECVDLVYPITVSVFNPTTELFDTIVIENDEMLHDFIMGLGEDDIANIEFPISLVLANGTELEASNLDELEELIEEVKDDCDEDDDNDFSDDNCDGCTVEQLEASFAQCNDFRVNKFKLGTDNLKSQYDDLVFNFQDDGSVIATSDTESFLGTWSASGSGNDITMVLDIIGLDDFNWSWTVNRILDTPGVTMITLEEGDGNTLRFKDGCNNGNGNGNGNGN